MKWLQWLHRQAAWMNLTWNKMSAPAFAHFIHPLTPGFGFGAFIPHWQEVANAFTSSKSLANRIKIKYLKYFSIMFVMHIKQFPQFIPSSKRKYALKAIQFNFVLLYLSHSRSRSFTCCVLPFRFRVHISLFISVCTWVRFFHSFSLFLYRRFWLVVFLNHCRWGNNMQKGKGNDIVGRLLT